MCGIFVSISRGRPLPVSPHIKQALIKRGPDSFGSFSLKHERHEADDGGESLQSTNDSKETIFISTFSTVLALRGAAVTTQPLKIEYELRHRIAQSFLCWNGEAWTFAGSTIHGNDSRHIFDALHRITTSYSGEASFQDEEAVVRLLSQYAGPYAFVFHDGHANRIYYGRDFLGRRSLLYARSNDGAFVLSSVTDGHLAKDWIEVETQGIHVIDLNAENAPHHPRMIPYSWRSELVPHGPPLLRLRKSAADVPTPTAAVNSHLSQSVDSLLHLLYCSLRTRLLNIPSHNDESSKARVAVLFSGGLDCSVLARLAHEVVPEDQHIDLLNVAFENPRVHSNHITRGVSPFELCPDRQTSRASYRQLTRTCPKRKWRLVCVDIPYSEYLSHRDDVIKLICPHDTEMDLSIASALYFAARGQGVLVDGSQYTTCARVLLSGLGADELFAGYTRHATAYNRGGWQALEDELALDISRLGKRNLGRDDRVISRWAREARYPFLDENVIAWALGASTQQKCGFGLEPSLDQDGQAIDPAKLVLRLLATKLDMGKIAHEKKRAIQFGARTAKMTQGNTRGTTTLKVEQ